ncbi:amino acid--tRNA ligase-related protein [Amycolatopsis sp.]|uniref:amino acid--tRNA ligase-related protein n=1 Tax=Amycolatopsis sp. TaxID=37632 RepID=UPI002D7F58CA|nr:amino acid--tRNA ligase-related protein [Amycolatopsis sp.]HET6705517.1 amino acid--tRNA ligase-related protein [Amycolatopsis sp.]
MSNAPALTGEAAAEQGTRPRAAWSADEFSPLAEVVVGTAAGARIPALDRSAWLNLYPDLTADELAQIGTGAFPAHVLAEAEQDLDALADILAGLGVAVHRPAPVAHEAEFATPHWHSRGFYSYCPRDLALVVGSTIIQAPGPMRARMFELAGLRELFQDRMLAGSAWIAAPTPQLRDELYPLDEHGQPTLGETEPVFDAANVLRAGRDLYYLVSGSGNELGARWLQTTLSATGDYRVHPIRGIYPHTHIDSTISLIRDGLALLNPARITDPAALPAPLASWKHLWCPPMTSTPVASANPLSSEWIGMNLLMVRPDLAIVDAAQRRLIALLERHGVDVVPHTLRHARVLGGGFHCVTLDLRRTPSATPDASLTREIVMLDRADDAHPQLRPTGSLAARYAELRAVPAARKVLVARSRVLDVLRRGLHDSGHVEVDTPLLQRSRPAPGRSFRTETQSLDPHIYLRSSPLHLRAMLTTGLERVFEIGRSFRDEPVDPTHSPEYSLVELYQAGADYTTLRTTARELITAAARAVISGTELATPSGDVVDLAAEWPVVPFHTAVGAALHHPVDPATPAAELRSLAEQHDVPVRAGADAEEILLELYDHLVEAATTAPTFYVDFPAGPSPLAKACGHDPRLAQKWDLVIGGREIATAYTELADAAELRARLAPDGDRILSSEAATLDEEWLEVFAGTMPEAGGLCIGLERLLLTVTGAAALREVIPFPLPEQP